MRKLIALSVAGLLVAGLLGGVAAAGKKKKKKPAAHQHVEASILFPQGGNAAAPCVYRTQRALYIAFGDAINGVFGYTFEVDPKTAGLSFKIDVSGPSGIEGVDIQFYADLGTDPTAEAGANVGYETPGSGGEEGTVPAGYPNAFVCLTEGGDATFTYMAGSGVK
jgi:hypothetical protein